MKTINHQYLVESGIDFLSKTRKNKIIRWARPKQYPDEFTDLALIM